MEVTHKLYPHKKNTRFPFLAPFKWPFFERLPALLRQPDDFPEMETLWLLTRAWNTGILLYSLAQYPEAEKWCGLAMSFIRHLGSLRESYETQVQDWWRGGGEAQ